jgi:hypothetical protein
MSAQPVDVLAVLDFHIAEREGSGTRAAQQAELIEARAAVADLIATAEWIARARSFSKVQRARLREAPADPRPAGAGRLLRGRGLRCLGRPPPLRIPRARPERARSPRMSAVLAMQPVSVDAIARELSTKEVSRRCAFAECGSDIEIYAALMVGDEAELGRLVRLRVQREIRDEAELIAEARA